MRYVCKYCNFNDALFINRINNYSLYRCNKCLILQTHISYNKVKKNNLHKYSNQYLNDYKNKRGKQLIRFYLQSIEDIEKYQKGGRLLDVGCSIGLFLRTLVTNSVYKWNIRGVDINRNSINKAYPSIKRYLINIPFNKNKLLINSFDVITCFDVIEHVQDLKKFMLEIRRLLRSKGLLVIQVPNSNSLMRLFTGNDWDWWCLPDHVYHFTPQVLIDILHREKFSVIHLRTWDELDIFIKNIQGHIRNKLINYYPINKIISKLVYVPLFVLWFMLNKVIRTKRYGGLIYLLAIKK